MNMSLIQTLEAMPWGEYREVTTNKGAFKLKTMYPVPSDFWNLWRAAKEEMMKNGYTMANEKSGWVAKRWVKWIKEETAKALIEESMAVDSARQLMKPPALSSAA